MIVCDYIPEKCQELCSPVKFGPSIKKKARQSLNWQNCVICQEPGTNEDLINIRF